MELKPGQPVFMKEATGNVWKTGVNNQSAKEPESYWIKFPDNSITEKDMIHDQAKISTFLFWTGSWRQRMEQYMNYSTMFSPTLQLNAPSTRATSFTNGQAGSTAIDWYHIGY